MAREELDSRVLLLLNRMQSILDELKQAGAFQSNLIDHVSGHASVRSTRRAEPDYASMAERMYFDRRKRDDIFMLPCVFGEPAWDILLDLMIARERGQKLSVTAVTQGSAAASTTALRYVSILENLGLVERKRDPNDARRTWLHLTDAGYKKMTMFFDKTSETIRSSASFRVLETGEIRLL